MAHVLQPESRHAVRLQDGGVAEPAGGGEINNFERDVANYMLKAADQRIATLEAALREIAVGLMPEDSAADQHNRYELCAARLCGIARRAITSETKVSNDNG